MDTKIVKKREREEQNGVLLYRTACGDIFNRYAVFF